jgi:serine/threonine protein kinase
MTSDFAGGPPSVFGGLGPGSRIAGYQIEERIGAGGMAAVFRARDEVLGRFAAVKVIAPSMAADPEFRARFLRESRAAAAVDSLHIIPVYGAGETGDLLYSVTRFVAGGDLAALTRGAGGVLAPARALSLLEQVASALDASHAAGLVHRDVKPQNILVDSVPERLEHAFLCDFGLCRATRSPAKLTATGQYLGTPDYSSPEQIRNKSVDGRTDQYALACVAFALLTGALPFHRGEVMATLFAQVNDPVPPATEFRPGLPATVNEVIGRGLAKSAANRYASCGEFAEALRAALTQDPAALAPGRPPETAGEHAPPIAAAQTASTITRSSRHAGQAQGPATGGRSRQPQRRHKHAVRIGGTAAVLLTAGCLIYAVNLSGNAHGASPSSSPPSPKRSSTSSPAPQLSATSAAPAANPPGTITLPGGGLVDSVQFSADGKFIAATSDNAKYSAKVYVVNTRSDSLAATFTIPAVTVGKAIYPPLAQHVNFSADDASLTVTVIPNSSDYATMTAIPYATYRWSLATGERVLVNSLSQSNAEIVFFSGDGQTVAEEADNSSVVYFARAVGVPPPALTLTSDADVGTGLDNNGDRFLSEDSRTKAAQVWDTENRRIISTLLDDQSFYTPYLSPDGNTVVEVPVQGSAPDSATPTLWDVATQSNVTPTDSRWQQQSTSGSFSSDGSVFWTARSDGEVDLWNMVTHKYLSTITDPMAGKNELTLGPGGVEAAFLGSAVSVSGNQPVDGDTEYRQIYIWKHG